jgi:hypothetical protein
MRGKEKNKTLIKQYFLQRAKQTISDILGLYSCASEYCSLLDKSQYDRIKTDRCFETK